MDPAGDDGGTVPEIGCIMLRDVRFFDLDEAPDAPPGWSSNIIRGRSYDLASPEGSYVEQVLDTLLSRHLSRVPGEVFGQPRLSPVRVG